MQLEKECNLPACYYRNTHFPSIAKTSEVIKHETFMKQLQFLVKLNCTKDNATDVIYSTKYW